MSVRGAIAVAHSRLLQLGRSPIALVVLAAFVLLLIGLPDPGGGGGAGRSRQAASWALAAGSALLGVTALLVPIAGGGPSMRSRESRILGRAGANLGHAAAALGFLLFMAGLLTLGSWMTVALRFGDPDSRPGSAVVRRLVWRNPDAITLGVGERWESRGIPLGALAGTVTFEVEPRLRFVDAPLPDSAAAEGPSHPTLEISWAVDGGHKRTRRVSIATTGRIEQGVEVPRGGHTLTLGLRLLGRGVEVGIAAGGVSVVGGRTALLGVLGRALLVVACAASVLSAVAQWFSNFVGPLIAVAAALTLALAAAAAAALIGRDLLPYDPVAAMRRGHETGWIDVAWAFAAAAVAIAATSLAAVASRAERGRRDPLRDLARLGRRALRGASLAPAGPRGAVLGRRARVLALRPRRRRPARARRVHLARGRSRARGPARASTLSTGSGSSRGSTRRDGRHPCFGPTSWRTTSPSGSRPRRGPIGSPRRCACCSRPRARTREAGPDVALGQLMLESRMWDPGARIAAHARPGFASSRARARRPRGGGAPRSVLRSGAQARDGGGEARGVRAADRRRVVRGIRGGPRSRGRPRGAGGAGNRRQAARRVLGQARPGRTERDLGGDRPGGRGAFRHPVRVGARRPELGRARGRARGRLRPRRRASRAGPAAPGRRPRGLVARDPGSYHPEIGGHPPRPSSLPTSSAALRTRPSSRDSWTRFPPPIRASRRSSRLSASASPRGESRPTRLLQRSSQHA